MGILNGRRLVGVVAVASMLSAGCAGGGGGIEVSGGDGSDVVDAVDASDAPEKKQPGDLVDVRPLNQDVVPKGARGWAITYMSVGVHGDLVEVNGVVFAPTGTAPAEGRPVVSWAHGGGNKGIGVADQCAPTQEATVTVPFAEDFIASGAVVAATDYEGLGQDGIYPYMVAVSSARSVIDAARASRGIPGAGAGDDVVLFGHSAGGQAAAMGGAVIEEYAPDLSLKGVVAVGAPLGLGVIMTTTASIPAYFGFFALAVKGYDYAYEDLSADDVLTDKGVELLAEAETACLDDFRMLFADLAIEDVLKVKPHEHERWAARFAENEPIRSELAAPVMLVHGKADATVLEVMSKIAKDELCAAGNTVDLRVKENAGHVEAIAAAKGDIVPWIKARLKGQQAKSTC